MSIRLTIIGAGPGGYVAAIRAAQRGAKVTVIEEAEVGGVCLNMGCIPTKTLVSSAERLIHARQAVDFGIEIPCEVGYNLSKIRERRDKVISTQVKGIRQLFKARGISLIPARGFILSPDVVRAVQKDGTTQDIKSDRIIIATGSRPAAMPGITFDADRVMTSDDAVRLTDIPPRLLIIGAGVIGCEFAFIYRAFGSEVTMVEMMPHALSTEDEEISGIIERELKKAKIRLITGAKVDAVEKAAGGLLQARLSTGEAISIDKVLVSIGRGMNSSRIGLEAVGVQTGGRKEIIVNDRMETNVPGIYAVGDVTGKALLAHAASHQGLVAVENALGGDERMDYSVIPAGIFTMPEVGSVGMKERDAAGRGIEIKVGRFQFRGLGKAHAMGEIVGMAKVIADAKSDRVLGVHICGAHATDLIHEGVIAIKKGVTAQELGKMIHAHPTLAEAIMEAAEDVHGISIHAL